jgi:hypothetical protein
MADDFGSLGGASFKVVADAGEFMRAMDNAEKKAATSSRAISTSVSKAGEVFEVLTGELGTYAVAEEKAAAVTRQYTPELDKQVAAAVRATQAEKILSLAVEEHAVAQRTLFVSAMEGASAQMALAGRAASASTAVGMAGNSSRTSALGFLYLSQAIEDAQYGFSAIVNNIPLIVMAMGGGAGLAGTVSILAVGLNIALNHWEDLSNAFRSGSEREAAEQMAELADKTEKAAKAFEHLKEAKTKSEGASGKAFSEGLTEGKGGPELFQKQLSEALQSMGQAPSISVGIGSSLKVGFGAIASAMFGGGSAREIAQEEINRLKAEALAQKSAALIGAASSGDEAARSQIAAVIKRNPNAFSPEFRKAFEESSPAAIRAKAAEKEDAKLRDEAIDKQNKATEDEGKRWKKLRDDNAKEEKQNRIRALEDQRRDMQERNHQEDLQLAARKEQLGQGSQTLTGAKAVADFYQKAALDSPLIELAKATKVIQEMQHQDLLRIEEELAKERAVRPGA